MKQYDYIYTNTNKLKQFMQEELGAQKLLVQLFCADNITGNLITQEVHLFSSMATVTVVVSPAYHEKKLHFTLIDEEAELVSEPTPMEYNFFNSGPVVIFKREPKGDCWIVTHVTSSVSQWGYIPSFFLDDEDAVKDVFHKDDMQRVRDT